jgi:hypothetical protein
MVPVVVAASEGAEAAHRALLSALDHADMPLERIAELVDPVAPTARPAVCTTALLTHDYDGVPEDEPDPRLGDVEPEHWSDLDLVLHVQPGPAGTRRLLLSGQRQMFDLPTLRRLLADLTEALDGWSG